MLVGCWKVGCLSMVGRLDGLGLKAATRNLACGELFFVPDGSGARHVDGVTGRSTCRLAECTLCCMHQQTSADVHSQHLVCTPARTYKVTIYTLRMGCAQVHHQTPTYRATECTLPLRVHTRPTGYTIHRACLRLLKHHRHCQRTRRKAVSQYIAGDVAGWMDFKILMHESVLPCNIDELPFSLSCNPGGP